MPQNPVYSLDFQKIFNEYFHTLMLFAKRYRLDEEECESIAQDCLISLWEHRSEFPDYLSVRAYLYATVQGKALNTLRHQKVENKYLMASSQTEEMEDSFMEAVIEEETQRLLFNAIQDLPEQSRKILLLNLEGKTTQEIAEFMSISVDTVKFHKKNAYKILRKKLKNQFYLILQLPYFI